MADSLHPEATHNVPIFITAPGHTDVLLVVTALFLLAAVVGFGVFYFRLHSLPEHVAHRGEKVQMEIVSILCLIALFTHEHIFWIAGLLLAFIDLPDFGTPLRRIAGSVARMAGAEPPAVAGETAADTDRLEQPVEPPTPTKPAKQDAVGPPAKKQAVAAEAKKERSHA